jgi:hypothetical protein
MCYLYVYICLWMYWITNIMISMYMYLVMLYPINALIWLYATTAYHFTYWNVSDNRVICHICIPYYILKIFRLSSFSTIGIYPFIYSNLYASPSSVVNVYPYGWSHKLTKHMPKFLHWNFPKKKQYATITTIMKIYHCRGQMKWQSIYNVLRHSQVCSISCH